MLFKCVLQARTGAERQDALAWPGLGVGSVVGVPKANSNDTQSLLIGDDDDDDDA